MLENFHYDEFYEGLKDSLKEAGFGKEIDTSSLIPFPVIETVKDIFYYSDVLIYVNPEQTQFYFVKDNKALYMGNVDSEGTDKTILTEIVMLSALVNGYMVIANGDDVGLAHLRKTENFDVIFLESFVVGYQKGMDNNHYTKGELFPQENIH